MGAINIGSRGGGNVKVTAPDGAKAGTEVTLPKHDGTLATLEDISSLTDLDAEALVNLADQVEENKQDIMELEEEIEAIAPTFDRGEWDFNEPVTLPAEPLVKTYHTLKEDGGIALLFANTHKVVFSNTDALEGVHTWADVEVGQYIEIFDEKDGEFLFAKVDAIQIEDRFASFEVTVQKSDGGPRGVAGDDDYSHRVRVKFFTINSDIDLSAYMPITGGTFTGEVEFSQQMKIYNNFTHVRASLAKPIHTIKTNPPLNEDGTDNIEEPFGLAIDVDNSNTPNNRFIVKNRKGDILTVRGGASPSMFYNKKTDEFTYAHEVVTKAYVDLMTLSSDHTGHRVVVPGSGAYPYNLQSKQFATNVKEFPDMYEIYVDEIYLDNKTTVRRAKDYIPTRTSEFQIWYGGVLQMAMNIYANSWTASRYDENQRFFKGVQAKPYAAVSGIYTASRYYTIRLTDMRYASY